MKRTPLKRTAFSPKVPPAMAYRVFERDDFACQYCGAKAPDVKLEPDHKLPVSRGGRTTDSNLITSCLRCNRGKGKKPYGEERASLY